MTTHPDSITTLPGTLPGLLRRGAPVVPVDRVVGDEGPGVVHLAFPNERGGISVLGWTPIGGSFVDNGTNVALDLTDPAGRDVAARWLAEKVGLTVGATAPRWELPDGKRIGWALIGVGDENGRGSWRHFHDHDRYDGNEGAIRVPGISAVTDPAEALALACLSLAAS